MELTFQVDLTGKTAIVTGGSGTLCSCMAEALAMNGCKVAIIGRGKEKLDEVAGAMQAKGLNVKGFSADVCKKDTLEKAYEESSEEFVNWAEEHEELEDLLDDVVDRMEELGGKLP